MDVIQTGGGTSPNNPIYQPIAQPESAEVLASNQVIFAIIASPISAVWQTLAGGAPNSRPKELLTLSEAAEYLRCKEQRIYDLRSDGRLPQTKEGGRVLIRRSDLDTLVVEGGAF